ncbi:glycine zipper 2TM domain-containing protein [Novosphingobium sp. 1949]|uniref:17 kDa surface antigen n=1 Tax=Novosphingobium organovorum TaxID=2930092 RepID=A0ABT0BAV5_9SPHN|nr:glycine zipper 2TM domain-containing protein [Novosphingobium organovorum]MCJ2182196.1 glycine zipper 2TM domain-containing protein [Novosphingobium organovorum]
MRLPLLLAAGAALVVTAPGAFAQSAAPMPVRYGGFDPVARDAWLVDCRQKVAARDSQLGGALIGGAVGALAGNRIAGRGNRTVGTLVGAGVGAVAGAAIDGAADHARARDECEAYLDAYYKRYTSGGYATYSAGSGYGADYTQPGYRPDYAIAPAKRSLPAAQADCTETVEYVTEDEPERPARRTIPPRPKPRKAVPSKAVKITPSKTVSLR